MDDKERTKNHMHFVIAKGYFETQYTDKKITYEQYEAATKVLYDKFQMAEVEQWIDANRRSGLTDLEPIRQTKSQKKKDVTVISKAPSEKAVHPYASLTDMARHYNEDSPGYVIQAWMRSHNTIEFLDIWEQENNPNYSRQGYELLLNKIKILWFFPLWKMSGIFKPVKLFW